MAEIKPIKAWRYNKELSKNMEDLISPLFDVITQEQKDALYQLPYNSIHLSLPRGEDPGHKAAQTWKEWQEKEIISVAHLPAIYIVYQYFSLPNSQKKYCRKGFICNIRIQDWSENIILRHENTIPEPVEERKNLLAKSQIMVSPTHGLYADKSKTLEAYMDENMEHPLFETEDYQGVKTVVGSIYNAKVIQKFVDFVKDKSIILADGHHRYQASLEYMQEQKKANPDHTGTEAYNFHLMYLSNSETDDIIVLPTHRIIKELNNFSEEELIHKLKENFKIKKLHNPANTNFIISGKKFEYGLIFEQNAYQLKLKPGRLEEIAWNFPDEVKELDQTVLHYFIIEKALNIPGKNQRTSPHIAYEKNFTKCMLQVIKKEAQCAVITNGISMKEIKRVSQSGHILPQKSSYFYPKLTAGFLFSSIRENES
jgi:uncharacterized protein (DUF1015 family)